MLYAYPLSHHGWILFYLFDHLILHLELYLRASRCGGLLSSLSGSAAATPLFLFNIIFFSSKSTTALLSPMHRHNNTLTHNAGTSLQCTPPTPHTLDYHTLTLSYVIQLYSFLRLTTAYCFSISQPNKKN